MAEKEKQSNEVIVRNEIAMDHTTFYVDVFQMIMSPSGAFKLQGFSEHIERPYEEKYVNNILEKNGSTRMEVSRFEQFEIVITPNMAIQLYNLIGDQLHKLGIPTEIQKNVKEEKKVEVIDTNYR